MQIRSEKKNQGIKKKPTILILTEILTNFEL